MVEVFFAIAFIYCLVLFIGAAIGHDLFVDPPVWTSWFWWPAIWRHDFEPPAVRAIVLVGALGGLVMLMAAWLNQSPQPCP